MFKVQIKDLPVHRVKKPDKSNPENSIFDYCRNLKDQGYPGETVVESYREDVLSLSTTVCYGSEHTIIENEFTGPRTVKNKPFPKSL